MDSTATTKDGRRAKGTSPRKRAALGDGNGNGNGARNGDKSSSSLLKPKHGKTPKRVPVGGSHATRDALTDYGPDLDRRQLLLALTAFKNGDFTARLPI